MKKVIIASMIGNTLEWYDYALYAQFITYISKSFFPCSDISEFLAFIVFAIGFIVRPMGGIVFGMIGDKYGRRLALMVCMITMALPTASIGLLPTFESIGWSSTIILVVIRLIQSFSLGGELSGCTIYLVELAPSNHRGLIGSLTMVSACVGMLLGAFTSNAFVYFFTTEQLQAGIWRIPFLAGLFIGIIGIYIRKNLAETPMYNDMKLKGNLSRTPIKTLFSNNFKELLVATGVYITLTAPFYTLTIYMNILLQRIYYQQNYVIQINVIMLLIMIIMIPLSALIGDRIGRKPVLLFSSISLIICTYPIFKIICMGNSTYSTISIVLFTGLVSCYISSVPTLMVEIFPSNVRFTGSALAQNISAALFGGTIPLVAAIIQSYTRNEWSISYYLIILAFISLLALNFYQETYKKDLISNE